MKKFFKVLTSATLAASVLVASGAQAHGFWFAQRANHLAMVFGVGADDLDVIKRLPKITSFGGYDEDGSAVPSQLVTNGALVSVNIDNQPAFIAAAMDYGMWSKTPDGKWHNKGKDEVPTAVISEHNFKYGVHLRRELSGPMPLLPDQLLQIVPVATPLPVKHGEPLQLRVLHKGKPAAGARVLADYVNDPDDKGAVADKDGMVTIKVRNQGLNVIVAIFKSAPANPAKVNQTENLASLSFVLPHEPE